MLDIGKGRESFGRVVSGMRSISQSNPSLCSGRCWKSSSLKMLAKLVNSAGMVASEEVFPWISFQYSSSSVDQDISGSAFFSQVIPRITSVSPRGMT